MLACWNHGAASNFSRLIKTSSGARLPRRHPVPAAHLSNIPPQFCISMREPERWERARSARLA